MTLCGVLCRWVQIASTLKHKISVPWPDYYKNLVHTVASWFDVFEATCNSDDFYDKFMHRLYITPGILGGIWVLWLMRTQYRKWKQQDVADGSKAQTDTITAQHMTAALFVLFLMCPIASLEIFELYVSDRL